MIKRIGRKLTMKKKLGQIRVEERQQGQGNTRMALNLMSLHIPFVWAIVILRNIMKMRYLLTVSIIHFLRIFLVLGNCLGLAGYL